MTEHPLPQTNPEVSVVPTREAAPDRIFLQPECAVDPYGEGRQWCEDDVWEECGEPGCECKAVRYVREDLAHQTPPATQPGATVGEAIAVKLREMFPDWEQDQLESIANELSQAATLHTPPPVATATVEARPEAEWHEDMGDVLWWKFPVTEAPWVGSPLGSDWPEYHTHFTPLPPIPATPTPPAGGQ